jgi:hypothetical protein
MESAIRARLGFCASDAGFPTNHKEPGCRGVFPPACSRVAGVPVPGRVGEWLKPADCKSAAPCGLRRFESSPVHHVSRGFIPPARRQAGWGEFPIITPSHSDSDNGTARTVRFWPRALFSRTGSRAWVAQLVERVLGKDEVTGSIPVPGSSAIAMGGGNSAVESRPSKPMVAGSNPVPRSIRFGQAGRQGMGWPS